MTHWFVLIRLARLDPPKLIELLTARFVILLICDSPCRPHNLQHHSSSATWRPGHTDSHSPTCRYIGLINACEQDGIFLSCVPEQLQLAVWCLQLAVFVTVTAKKHFEDTAFICWLPTQGMKENYCFLVPCLGKGTSAMRFLLQTPFLGCTAFLVQAHVASLQAVNPYQAQILKHNYNNKGVKLAEGHCQLPQV